MTDDENTDAVGDAWGALNDPPDDARPRAWWHWMDGNVDPEGIVRDLEWMHRVGLRGAQVFDGGMGVPPVVDAPVRPGTDAWADAVDTAARVASERGMELAVATSSGWSAAGGPWVTPEDAMKKVVSASTRVTGGARVEVTLPPLPDTPGPCQDAPRWGEGDGIRWSTDWRVLAVPADAARHPLHPDVVRTSADSGADAATLTDGSFAAGLSLPRAAETASSAWIEQVFAEPVEVRSVVVGLPGPSGFGAAPAPRARLQASPDGETWTDVVALDVTTVPVRTASFAPVRAPRFRLLLEGAPLASALPAMAPGVRVPPVLRGHDAFLVTQFSLRSAARVHLAEVKSGLGVVPDFYAVDTPVSTGTTGAIDPAHVIDVTAHVRDGVLTWDAPDGEWEIIRLGASLTGATNGPAPADATGLEVDKLDGARVRAYLRTHLARIGDGAEGAAAFSALVSDSIETGAQNFTPAVAEEFRARRGYDPTPYLPTLVGAIVGDAATSDRFLYDYRRTIADLLAAEYYGTLAAEAAASGMTLYSEALEDARPQLGDDLAMRAHADVPMGAMWAFEPADGPRPTYVADLRGAASVAHVYGRRWVGSEAFTSFGQPWTATPASLKHIADLQLALGVTRFLIHTSAHQPITTPPPGLALAPFLGQTFTALETWAEMAGPWVDYLAGCSAVLSLGMPLVRVAVFVGEEAPVTGLFAEKIDTAVPAGIGADYVGFDALVDVLRAEDGRLHARGASYDLLHLGGSSRRMTLAALRRIQELVDGGATVVGHPPEGSPSLSDDPAEVARAIERLWSGRPTRGRVLATDLSAAVEALGIRPELEVDDGDLRRIDRRLADGVVTFLADPRGTPRRVALRSPAEHLSVWDPVARRRWTPADGILELPPFGSVFVVTTDTPQTDAAASTPMTRRVAPAPVAGWTLDVDDRTIPLPNGPVAWTDLDDALRGFSGIGTYRATLAAATADAEPGADLVLDLGVVHGIARVTCNGVDCGVAWTTPYRVDVGSAWRAGANDVRVDVATPWRNRLIAEAAEPSGEIFAPMAAVFEPNATPIAAGLAGPIAVISAS
ncbi:glycosyl hydrolase [Microbacterium aurantiacum]|uniref:glycosyl hydrolase n=1 Tax=Microbacterium aurantiacum TaxID=162393 RepID=UPI004036F33E